MSSDSLLAVVWIVDLGPEPDHDAIQTTLPVLRELLEVGTREQLSPGAALAACWIGIKEWPERIIDAIGPESNGEDILGRPARQVDYE